MKLVGVSGTLSGQKTSQTVFAVLNAAKQLNREVEVELIDLKDYEIEFMQGWPLSYYNDDTQTVVNKILEADGIVLGTPIYQASIAGALKNLARSYARTGIQGKSCRLYFQCRFRQTLHGSAIYTRAHHPLSRWDHPPTECLCQFRRFRPRRSYNYQ